MGPEPDSQSHFGAREALAFLPLSETQRVKGLSPTLLSFLPGQGTYPVLLFSCTQESNFYWGPGFRERGARSHLILKEDSGCLHFDLKLSSWVLLSSCSWLREKTLRAKRPLMGNKTTPQVRTTLSKQDHDPDHWTFTARLRVPARLCPIILI